MDDNEVRGLPVRALSDMEFDQQGNQAQEGSKMPGMKVWAKEHYDWSSPDVVTWTVIESTFCAPGSHVSATIEARDVGGSHIHVAWDRTPTSLIDRFATLMIVATRGSRYPPRSVKAWILSKEPSFEQVNRKEHPAAQVLALLGH